ncbi:S8 family peptidase [Sporichthya polymorpha]|uniref:S8 family peptidase n=1 Tax=Sporichthya polymorpha TaxID=35751 RepID=UPI0003719291|nr:S8 family serine peptidase [Sporichthya polymorpha]
MGLSRVRAGTAALTVLTLATLAGGPALAADADDGFGKNAWWYQAMKIDDAHQISTGKGVTIAVIDGPIDPSVPELKGQDVTPVKNFCGGKPTATGPLASHGTGVVVKIVGNGKGTAPGGVGVAGIAPEATVRAYAVDVDAAPGLQCPTKTMNQGFADAIEAAVKDGARIISMSVAGDRPAAAERAAVEQAFAAGAVVVAGVGNAPEATSTNYPAAYPGVVAVAAVDREARPWSGNPPANREAFVIAAPGVRVTTGGFDGVTWSSAGFATGTSEATPLVAGALALVASKYPNATGNQLISHLIHNPGGTQTFGRTPDLGYGIVSPTKMLASDPTQWPDTNPLLPPSTPSPDSSSSPPAPTATVASEDGGSGGTALWAVLAALIAVLGIGAAVLARRRQAR